MTRPNNKDSRSRVRKEGFGGIRFLSDEESSHYAALAEEHLSRVRPDINPKDLLPIRAVELDNDEMRLEYARHHCEIPFYRGPQLFIRMKASGELSDLKTDWAPCQFESEPMDRPPTSIQVPEDHSCIRSAYALDVSAVIPFYLFPPRLYDQNGKRVLQGEKLGPWEWIDLRGGSSSAKRSVSAPMRPLQGRIPVSDSRRPEPLDRDELRRARSAVLDYLLRSTKPRAYRWAFLAGRQLSSFRAASGGFAHVRVYRLVNGLPVLGACLDLYVERRSGKLAAASDELHFRRLRPERFAEALYKPRLSENEAWEKLKEHIRVLPYYVCQGRDSNGVEQASLVWIEESEFVCDASSGRLLRAEIVRV
ncbi:hypothetical protein [Saccharibacillus sacchari]|uniref:hypothetical protein n=1 Tax=Saccharibacillus sacchari TaxID=456493 RepID=UPI0004AFEF7B|nr:hypothetical protein [Saccharibacillus sacchari]